MDVVIVLGAGVLTYLGWKQWVGSRPGPGESAWRNRLMLAALISLSVSTLLFVGYAGHNAATIGGDRNGNAITLLYIRSGNYLSAAAILLGLAGKGRARWLALVGGCFMLFLWLGQGMSL